MKCRPFRNKFRILRIVYGRIGSDLLFIRIVALQSHWEQILYSWRPSSSNICSQPICLLISYASATKFLFLDRQDSICLAWSQQQLTANLLSRKSECRASWSITSAKVPSYADIMWVMISRLIVNTIVNCLDYRRRNQILCYRLKLLSSILITTIIYPSETWRESRWRSPWDVSHTIQGHFG